MSRPFGYGEGRKPLSRRAGSPRTGSPPPVTTRRLKGFSFWGAKSQAAASSSWRYEPGLVVEKHGTGAAQTMRGGRSLEPVGRSGIASFQSPARSLDMLMRRDGSGAYRRSEYGKGLLRSENHQGVYRR